MVMMELVVAFATVIPFDIALLMAASQQAEMSRGLSAAALLTRVSLNGL